MKNSLESSSIIRLLTVLNGGVSNEVRKIEAGLGSDIFTALDAAASPVQGAVAELVAILARARLIQRAMIALSDPEALLIEPNDLDQVIYEKIFLDIRHRGKVGASTIESNRNRATRAPIEVSLAVYTAHWEVFVAGGGHIGWTRAKGRATQLLRRYKQPVAQYEKWLTKHYVTVALANARSVTAAAEYPSASEILALFEDGTI